MFEEEIHMKQKKNRYITRSGEEGRIIVSRLKPGSDLLTSLKSIAREENLRSGIILSAVGALKKAGLRNLKNLPEEYPITDENRSFKNFEDVFEILAISGNVFMEVGEIQVHAHVVLSRIRDEQVSVVGGHLIEGCEVGGFAEIMLMEVDELELEKTFDEETKTTQLFSD